MERCRDNASRLRASYRKGSEYSRASSPVRIASGPYRGGKGEAMEGEQSLEAITNDRHRPFKLTDRSRCAH